MVMAFGKAISALVGPQTHHGHDGPRANYPALVPEKTNW